MGLIEALARIGNPYERQARVWPALLALLPLIVMIGVVYTAEASAIMNVVAVTISCGALYLFAGICRERGRNMEPKLFEEWGGKPSTQLLRHRDSTIESVTKKRYHAFLAAKINTPFPDEAEEAAAPAAADEIYQSAVRWLLNHTRDPKEFGLLLQENIAYGFRRNALGIKPVALLIAFSCGLWMMMEYHVMTPSSPFAFSTTALLNMPGTVTLSLTVSVLMLLIWGGYFTKKSARTFAFAYAETLLRACDTLR